MQGNDSTRATGATLTCSQQRRWLDSVKSVFRENRRHLGLSQVLRRGLLIITAPELATGCKLWTLPDRRGCSRVFLLLSPIEKNQNEGRDKDYKQRRTQFRHPQTTFLEEKYSKAEFFLFFLGWGMGVVYPG